jgi:hypothetical protein
MNRMAVSGTVVGNDFVLPRPKKAKKMKVEASIPALTLSPEEVLPNDNLGDVNDTPKSGSSSHDHKPPSTAHPLINLFHRHTVIIIAATVLLAGSATIKLGADYWAAKTIPLADNTASIRATGKPLSGFNLTVPAADFQAKLGSITGQPVTLKVGPYSERVDSGVVKTWLQITTNQSRSEYYIHVNESKIAGALTKEAKEYTRAPVNQLTVNEDGTSRIAVGGQNGRSLADPGSLKTQAHAVAKNVLAGKGLDFNTPLKTQPFHAVTPASFDKLIVADTTVKKMWLFQNGHQVKSYLVSAGKPTTPTPIGEFHVYAKFASQDMRGLNTDGTRYFQPHVYWVNYFSAGNAIHGVYWHPLSWFGAINSSHGCIGIPDDEAEWVYNWTPIGTTVVVHT